MKINKMEFSDLISGYVKEYGGGDRFTMTTSDGRDYEVILGSNLYARLLRNLGEPYSDATPMIRNLLKPGQMAFVYGIFYPNGEAGDSYVFEAKCIDFPGKNKDDFRFEEEDWWSKQSQEICDFFLRAQFPDGDINYDHYRTSLMLTGERNDNTYRQETDTISRMIYGMASAFMLTGEDRFLEAAEKGCKYMQDHLKFYDVDENIVYWYHGIDVKDGREHKVFASEFGDDYDAVPMYEQIYALAGLTQTYRVTGNTSLYRDIKMTVDLFEHFHDKERGGYYSHIDPIFLDPLAESLGRNKGKKNWNSVGDHAPAYLINLCLATDEKKYWDFLVETADTITNHFQDYENSPFVQEKFNEDWSHDYNWGWQQNRAVVGHNLKIAWNLMRINGHTPKESYVEFAERIAAKMPKVGMDIQRFGWYDVMERKLFEGESFHRFAWHDRKAWWQQEQGILAYQILYGVLGKDEYQKYARESAAFYNTFFLDHDDGAVYFNVLNNGLPYLLGTERMKGSHSMSAYHSVELCYLSAVYLNLLTTKKPLSLYFKPEPGAFRDDILHVSPDILPKGTILVECGEMLRRGTPKMQDGKPVLDKKGRAVYEPYHIKVLNTINFKKSMHYNPFMYIRSEKDILKLVNTIIANTKGEGEKSSEDFWVKAERLLYCALIGYIYYEAPEEEQNFSTLLEFINASEAREDDEEFKNAVDELFEDLELGPVVDEATGRRDTSQAKPEHFAVRQYKKYKLAAGKTAKSILISCGARLAPFDIAELRELTSYDEMELDMVGDQRTAMFVIISDTDDTFNFIVAIMYTQLFNLLCDRADDVHGGRLPYHVRLLLDEFANIGQIPKFDKLIATIRSREISASIILQSQSQLKTIYKDAAETILGNCDTMLFLGGKEGSTLKEISETLGKETIDLYNTSDTRGQSRSYGLNYQKTGKELMSRDELAVMDGNKCILQLRGVRPFFSDKFDITRHKRYKRLSDYDSRNAFDVEAYMKHQLRLRADEEFELFVVDAAGGSTG